MPRLGERPFEAESRGHFPKKILELPVPLGHVSPEDALDLVLARHGTARPSCRGRILIGGDRLHPVPPTKPPPSGRGGMEYLRIARSSWDSWRGVTGFTLARLHRYAEAVEAWEKVTRLDPGGPYAQRARMHARTALDLQHIFASGDAA